MSSVENPCTLAHKLCLSVIKKMGEKQMISLSSPENAELKHLWEDCTSKNSQLAHACCEALVSLVTQGHAEFKYILHGLLNVTPTGRNLSGVIRAIGELLILQLQLTLHNSEKFHSPYGIRSDPHPLITILTNRPETWPLMLQMIQAHSIHSDDRVKELYTIELVKPFLRYVLLDPGNRHSQLRSHLESFLLSVVKYEEKTEIRETTVMFIKEIFPMMQIKSIEDLGHATAFLHDVLESLMSLEDEPPRATMSFFAHQMFSLCPLLLNHGLELGPSLKMLHILTELHEKSLRRSCYFSILSELLLMCPTHNLQDVLKLVSDLYDISCPCPLVAGLLMLPLLHIIANPTQGFDKERQHKIQQLAVACLGKTETLLREEQDPATKSTVNININPEICNYESLTNMALKFQADKTMAFDWLSSILSSSRSLKVVSQGVINMVASLFLTADEGEQLDLMSSDVLVEIARIDATKAMSLLPIFLYKLKKVSNPERKFSLLHTLPKLATNKLTVGPILRTIQMMSTNRDLHPMSIRLLCQLWQQQERCYPYLLKALLDEETAEALGADQVESTIAKAATVRDICKLKPHQHCSDMLALISKILNECTNDEEVIPAALALEGLHALCDAEVIEVKTAWKIMAEKLLQDSRPLITVKICELFAVVPVYRQDSPEYEEFVSECISYLWYLTQSECIMVQSAAYKALSAYKFEDFKFAHLPNQVKTDVKLPEPEGEGSESTLSYVPGSCYMRLLGELQPTVIPAFESLLTSLVKQEVANLPRGIHHTAMRRQNTLTADGKAINGIPHFLQTKYDQVKNPGLRPGLAAGLLFSYDPPVEVGRDGRPRKHYIVTHGRNYEHYLKSLLHEVPLQSEDWHRCIHVPEAWVVFMERMYNSCLEARKAEIEIQLRHEKIDEEQARKMKDIAWLWLRDHLTDLLKVSSKGHVTQQANSLFALTGLTLAVNKYASGIDSETAKSTEELSEFLGLGHWTLMVIETLISILDQNFEAVTRVLPWGNIGQPGSSYNQPSVLLRCSAVTSLPLLVPLMVTSDAERLKQVINVIEELLPGKSHVDDVPPALQFHAGLGLGMFVAALQQEHFSEVGGTQGMVLIWKTIDLLERISFDSKLQYRSGTILGLGVALVSLCSDSRMDSHVHTMTTLDKMVTLLDQMEPGNQEFECLCHSVAMVTNATYSVNAISGDIAQNVAEKFFQLHQRNKEVTGICLGLGLLCHGMQRVGHAMAEGIQKGLFTTWIQSLSTKETPLAEKMACLTGLVALVGSEKKNIGGNSVNSGPVQVADLVKSLCSGLSVHDDLTYQSRVAWLLGHFYQSSCSVVETRASVPVSYSYLPESSVLRAMVDSLQAMVKEGPESKCPEYQHALIAPLLKGPKQALPPCNWPGILAPVLRMSFGVDIKCLCLQVAASQSKKVSMAAMFLSSWIVSPLFETLNMECQLFLYESLPVLAKSASAAKLQQFLGTGCLVPFKLDGEIGERSQLAVMKGLKAALMITNPPQSVMGYLYTYVQLVYSYLTLDLKPEVLDAFCDCLSEVPDEVVDQVIAPDESSATSFMKGLYIRCWLVGHGKQPIALLNPCIDAVLRQTQCDQKSALWLFTKCFYAMSGCDGEYANVNNRLQWLLELMGHVRNSIQSGKDNMDVKQPLHFGLCVVAAAVITWSTRLSPMILALQHDSCGQENLPNMVVSDVINVVTNGFMQMMEKEPWKQINNKVVDWLLTMHELALEINQDETPITKGCVFATRHTEEAKRVGIWSRMAML